MYARLQMYAVLFMLAVAASACAQELLQTGPLGRPALVMDEADNWSAPISVYSDSDVELFIPDITAPGWVQWHAAQFRETGVYLISLFSFYKNDRLCRKERIPPGHSSDPEWLSVCSALRYQRRLFSVDTRKQTLTQLDAILMERDARYNPLNQVRKQTTIPLSKVALAPTFAHITTLVRKQVKAYQGPTAQQVLENNRKVTTGNAMRMMTPDGQQGCPGATPEQLANWHSVGCPPSTKPH